MFWVKYIDGSAPKDVTGGSVPKDVTSGSAPKDVTGGSAPKDVIGGSAPNVSVSKEVTSGSPNISAILQRDCQDKLVPAVSGHFCISC